MAGISQDVIAHVDLNSFFASVEQQANPLLRGKAVGVCAYLHKYGCVIAASVEAKKRGMKVGMTVEKAQKAVRMLCLCRMIRPNTARSVPRSSRSCTNCQTLWSVYSIDEAFLDLTGWYRDTHHAARALEVMRQRIRTEVGEWLGCSIGIAPTRFLAKTASDFKKPNGMTIITQENLDHILGQLELEAVCGVGPRTSRRLQALGYHTLLEVKRAPVANLIHAFGKKGYFLWSNLHGLEVEGVAAEEARPKSIGHSYCVPQAASREGKLKEFWQSSRIARHAGYDVKGCWRERSPSPLGFVRLASLHQKDRSGVLNKGREVTRGSVLMNRWTTHSRSSIQRSVCCGDSGMVSLLIF